MTNFTAPQKKALKAAKETGNAWNAFGNIYRVSTDRMMKELFRQGLLDLQGKPTEALLSA